MEKHKVKILSIEKVTHDTLRITTERPEDYSFEPGQATEIAINKNGWQNEWRPFTFTSLPEAKNLEFTIKTYPSHDGATDKLLDLEPGDELLLNEVFGAITFKGEGVFIAGGAGVTPFIAILRDLQRNDKLEGNILLFANKASKDIILKEEFEKMLGENFVNILSEEKSMNYAQGMIDAVFINKYVPDLNRYFYICGPEPMIDAVEKELFELGVSKDRIIKEDL
jgi:ferredoxin-NADP reductase